MPHGPDKETIVLKIHSQRDFAAGLLFSAFGVAFAWGATTYNVGNGARMGPGYFPLIVGVLIAILGAVITTRAMTVHTEDGEPIGAIAWRPLCFIIGANLVFGVLLGGLPSIGLPPMGLIVAVYALALVASLAGDQFHLKGVLILATILAVGSYLAFVVALNLQFPVWPSFIVG